MESSNEPWNYPIKTRITFQITLSDLSYEALNKRVCPGALNTARPYTVPTWPAKKKNIRSPSLDYCFSSVKHTGSLFQTSESTKIVGLIVRRLQQEK